MDDPCPGYLKHVRGYLVTSAIKMEAGNEVCDTLTNSSQLHSVEVHALDGTHYCKLVTRITSLSLLCVEEIGNADKGCKYICKAIEYNRLRIHTHH